jgi:hypothetical protein
MRNIYLTFGVLLSVFLTACAGRYHPVIADPAQSARLRVASVGKAWAYHLKDQCIPHTDMSLHSENALISALTKTKHQSIGMPTVGLPENASFEEVIIPAGIPINVAFVQGSIIVAPNKTYSDSCVIGVRFTPEPGADYQLLNSLSREQCTVSAYRIRLNDKGSQTLELLPSVVKLSPC